MYLYNTIAFESLRVENSVFVCGDILSGHGSKSYMKVIGPRSCSQQQKREIPSNPLKLQ